MGPVAIIFGIACAVVLVTAALCRSRDAFIAALVLAATWGVTKLFPADRDSGAGIMMAASCKVAIALVDLWIMHNRPRLIWPRIMVSSQLVAALFVALWACALNAGFRPSSYPYAMTMNVLYGIALLAVLSLGLHDGAVSFRTWLSGHHHDGAWGHPGARWGRTAEHPPRGLKQR